MTTFAPSPIPRRAGKQPHLAIGRLSIDANRVDAPTRSPQAKRQTSVLVTPTPVAKGKLAVPPSTLPGPHVGGTAPAGRSIRGGESGSVDEPSSPIKLWAGRVAATSPAPMSSHPAQTQSTHPGEEPFVIDGIEREAWEVMTEDPGVESTGIPADVLSLRLQHARQIAHYKNLLVRAQSASSSSLHDLHCQLHDLETRHAALQEEHSKCAASLAEASRRQSLDRLASESISNGEHLRSRMADLSRQDRVDLLGIMAGACHPSDIDAQLKILEKYKRSKVDLLGALPTSLAVKTLSHLPVPEILALRLVCRQYDEISRSAALWQTMCRQLEWRDADGEAGLAHLLGTRDDEWYDLFQKLWRRERNWSTGAARRVLTLPGHTNYVTSLKLKGDILISGSYDETIRIWHVPSISLSKSYVPLVLPAKAVSCLDYFAADSVIVVGTHDVGRVQVWRQDPSCQTWTSTHTLAGHLHGIRALAIDQKWLVSAGADKALVVWDWRTGEKVVKFGQQTNICVNVQLVNDHNVAVTVDGVIRVFSITRRDMVAQYRLSELHGGKADLRSQLQDIGGGIGGGGMVNWFKGQGRDMICATREKIFRLEWGETRQSILHETPRPPNVPSYASPRARTTSMARMGSAPLTPTKTHVNPVHLGGSGLKPVRRNSAQISLSIPKESTISQTPSPVRRGLRGVSNTSSASPTISTTPRRNSSRRTSTAPSSVPDAAALVDRLVPDFSKAPSLREIITAPDVERGAVDGRRMRIVTSTRFASRSGADRHLYISALDDEGQSRTVPVGGAWRDAAQELELQTPGKNPMSLVMDREKFAYGCTDGTIVVVSFA